MTHIFKPGDKAYWLRHSRWIYLIRNRNFPESKYPLEDQETHTYFTLEGKLAECNTPELLPSNPYNISDPNNPLMLRGRRLEVGMEMRGIFDDETLPVRIKSLELLESNCCVTCSWNYGEMKIGVIHPNNLRFPDELPNKKKVAKWAYTITGIPGIITVGFTEEMTLGEARKKFGSFVQMIPGTEREVEG